MSGVILQLAATAIKPERFTEFELPLIFYGVSLGSVGKWVIHGFAH